MPIKKPDEWKIWEDKNKDPYGKCAVDVAREAMRVIDEEYEGKPIKKNDSDKIISIADKNLDAGITGFMAGCVAQMISACHTRGDEFQTAWNEYWGRADEKEGVVNPAILTVNVGEENG